MRDDESVTNVTFVTNVTAHPLAERDKGLGKAPPKGGLPSCHAKDVTP